MTGAQDTPRQIDLATLGINVFSDQPSCRWIIVNLDDIAVDAIIAFLHATIVYLVHLASIDDDATGMALAGIDRCINLRLGDFSRIVAKTTLDQPVDIDGRCRQIDAATCDTPTCLGIIQQIIDRCCI